MIAHVALEVRPAQVADCLRFWAVLGFGPVDPPGELAARSDWCERDGCQVHLMHADAPVVPPDGHVALVLGDAYDATLERLRGHGREVVPRTRHWGSPRAFTRCPAGHRVELMAFPPRSAP